MREWLSIPPSDEIDPVALVQARQAEDSRDRLDLTRIERMDLVLHAHSDARSTAPMTSGSVATEHRRDPQRVPAGPTDAGTGA